MKAATSLLVLALLLASAGTAPAPGQRPGVRPTPIRPTPLPPTQIRPIAKPPKHWIRPIPAPINRQPFHAAPGLSREELLKQFNDNLAEDPLQALGHLGASGPGVLLPLEDVKLARRALVSLVRKLALEPEPSARLEDVRLARHHVARLDPRIDRPLMILEADIEESVLEQQLAHIEALRTQRRFLEASAAAKALHDLLRDATDLRDKNDPENAPYEGSGLVTASDEQGRFVVIRSYLDGPVYRAGVLPGDFVLDVNGRATRDMLMEEVVEELKGAAGTRVKLTIQRDTDANPRALAFTRARVFGKSVGNLTTLKAVSALTGERKSLANLLALSRGTDLVAKAEKAMPEQPAALRTRLRDALAHQDLPADIRESLHRLIALANVRAILDESEKPDVNEVKARFKELRDVGADPLLTARLQQEAAVSLFLQGRTADARVLLPKGGPRDHAGRLLKDVKVLLNGAGVVTTEPVQRAVDKAATLGKAPGGPLAGIGLLVPDDAARAWRLPERQRPIDDAAVQALARLEEAWRAEAVKAIRAVEPAFVAQLDAAFAPLQELRADHDRRRTALDEYRQVVVLQLQRPLNLLEVAMVRHEAGQGKSAAAAVRAVESDAEEPGAADRRAEILRVARVLLAPCLIDDAIAGLARTTFAAEEPRLWRDRAKGIVLPNHDVE